MNGLRVLNTRPLNKSGELNAAIIAAGGLPISLPALNISATDIGWLNNMPDLASINQAIFISANAVNYYFSTLNNANISWPSSIRVIAVGHATATALSIQGIQVHHVPSIADSEHVMDLSTLQKIQHQKILLIKGVGGRPFIATAIQSRGAYLISLAVYRRDLPEIKPEYVNSIWQNDAVDIILFTSQQAIDNIFTLFKEEGLPWLRSKPCMVISPRLAQIASSLGIRTIIISQHDKILDALHQYTQGELHDNQP